MSELIPLSEVGVVNPTSATTNRPRRPEWLKARAPGGVNYHDVLRLMREKNLHTVCEEARCPNIGECWNHRTATFLLLGDICTRGCRYCAIGKGKPKPIDEEEPERVAESVAHLRLKFAVLTSVNRDDVPDGGAHIFARTIELIRQKVPDCKVEVLIPDFDGNWDALAMVLDAEPDVLNHNIETVPRLFRRFRPRAKFEQSIELLARARAAHPHLVTKSGMMVGAGETNEEVYEVIDRLREVDVNVLTIGQYLAPDASYWPVHRYVTPAEFADFRAYALARGFRHVESGPLVRSSYNAHLHVGAAQH
ncbi:lipoyl synthase [Chloroflexus aggregans]|uniref:Lipoyl synthase n=1 Tax=Chloroflexus aggregans (strain MD-66 / DSM 9485) TaxID=326427 RepID=LIPA_CHLAD|nr:lipoyl synthase [Chloroflexus aggregans]B8G782.1 RecName: Full=Lipoyl synthase; AltName: Full=Lip-syn; Short=LS; AltName: Full=Lipoate synthase; AltName: Full=Lipoic acid synthase; AltName: Full=Sulfur insertion protein LipA [Chloroflexus aggregans DSM 9485]ACL24039.1 lipoic acid synthetase [Chloroflexus aggregans DSM 9485]